jgi:hypothetical protein
VKDCLVIRVCQKRFELISTSVFPKIFYAVPLEKFEFKIFIEARASYGVLHVVCVNFFSYSLLHIENGNGMGYLEKLFLYILWQNVLSFRKCDIFRDCMTIIRLISYRWATQNFHKISVEPRLIGWQVYLYKPFYILAIRTLLEINLIFVIHNLSVSFLHAFVCVIYFHWFCLKF